MSKLTTSKFSIFSKEDKLFLSVEGMEGGGEKEGTQSDCFIQTPLAWQWCFLKNLICQKLRSANLLPHIQATPLPGVQ